MKKILLAFTVLLGFNFPSFGQTIVPQNSGLAANNFIGDIQAIDANTAWGVAGPIGDDNLVYNTYLRTTNGGANWQGGPISATGLVNFGVGGLYAISATTAWAAVYPTTAGGSNGILKTTDGGTTWAQQPSAAFRGSNAFANWVYFFDANNGVCMGDPNTATGSPDKFFEIYTTADGGTTWVRVAKTPALIAPNGEFGIVNQYAASGNSIWFLTGYSDGVDSPVRVFRSSDRGLTWTAAGNTGFAGQASGIAFTNSNNGLVWQGPELAATTDGGTTWTTRPYSTPFRSASTTAIPNSNVYVSTGLDGRISGTGQLTANDFGVSISRDNGASWQSIFTGEVYGSISFISGTLGWVGGNTGPVGSMGNRGIGKYTGGNILSNGNAELQKALAVYPNPSTSGIFTVQLSTGLKSGASVRVLDMLGRQVAAQQLHATALAAKSTTVDLSQEKAGIYMLELQTESGVAQQKLIVE